MSGDTTNETLWANGYSTRPAKNFKKDILNSAGDVVFTGNVFQVREWLETVMANEAKAIEGRIRELMPERAALWMASPNKAFDFKTPNELIESGDLEPLEKMLHQLESGEPF